MRECLYPNAKQESNHVIRFNSPTSQNSGNISAMENNQNNSA
jgi:hypothetical protein